MTDLVLRPGWPRPGVPAPQQRTFWMRQAFADEPEDGRAPRLEGAASCDVCVVGGGYTGLWTALEILRRAPGTDVMLIDADVCGGGASGANAGYLMPLWGRFAALVAISDHAEARRIGEESALAVQEIGSFLHDNGIDADYRPASWLWAASSRAQDGAWHQTMRDLDRAEVAPMRPLSAEETRRLTGTRHHFGGVLDPGCATLNPAKLVRGMRRVALDLGVRVHERTPLTALRAGRRTQVRTPRGLISADRVVLAVNAWAGQVEDIGRRMVTVATDTLVTRPAPDALEAIGWDGDIAVTDSRRRLNFYRTTPDGRLLFGKGGIAAAYGRNASGMWGAPLRLGEVKRQMARLFPSLAGLPVEHAWTAPVEYSVTSLPFAGRLRSVPGVYYGAGYSGDGIAASRLMGKVLAALALGDRDEWSDSAFTRPPSGWIPPDPFRYLGANVVLSALRAREAYEDRGRRVPVPVRLLASIDPSAFGH